MIGDDAVVPDSLQHGAIKGEMQLAAMNADFRVLVARRLAARLPVDELAEAAEEAALGGFDAAPQEVVAEAKRREFAHRMRPQRYADAELFEFGRRFIDLGCDSAGVQVQRKRKPANSAADDGDAHVDRKSTRLNSSHVA